MKEIARLRGDLEEAVLQQSTEAKARAEAERKFDVALSLKKSQEEVTTQDSNLQ